MANRRTPRTELVCLALLFAFLLWLPLPFGSTPDEFQLPLVAGALAVCAITCVVMARARSRTTLAPAHRIWSGGAVLFMLIVALQLIEMPDSLLRLLSPESARIWTDATRVAAVVLGPLQASHPISIDPETTSLHLFRLLAYFATFTAAALLIRGHGRRVALATVLAISALFQTAYGMNEAAQHRFSIWGWKNVLIFNRVTGTFVNPNHFAHYAALIAPLGFFILALAWHAASSPNVRLSHRITRMVERRILPAAFGAIVVTSCLAAILVAKSRGALLALFAGAAVGLAAATGRRFVRTSLFLAAGVAAVLLLALYLGRERTSLSRFMATADEARSLGGRRSGIEAALTIWRRFPLLGSGLGTFIDLAPMVQPDDFGSIYNHAHDDYAEIAATTGTAGFLAFLVPLAFGLVQFTRSAFSGQTASWRRRAFHAAALASIVAALVHALVDFNFFIPANAATLAAIAGAAVATRSEQTSVRGSALEDSQA
jgi:O-antigen ligase